MVRWEYARFEYRSAGSLGGDRFMDWDAAFHHARGVERWGTDERFDDLRHLNRLGRDGWQVYDRGAVYLASDPHRMHSVTYSLRRAIKVGPPPGATQG
ncbi:hypothetical protein QEZ54_28925 [Catellatospora sp. KI3]|uniref:hypothetical protein n=1 Tax=Catellatospora sp. KI3 TaxID=3041620 RepID=UPI002483239A|nr:hypothetical protein [Catellatospora sp. KI3]MDI1465000.1 hypothetical protein [Catellatospora sp. KI3]